MIVGRLRGAVHISLKVNVIAGRMGVTNVVIQNTVKKIQVIGKEKKKCFQV